MSSAPIGMFDSGLGGLTVMQEILRQLPHENIIYMGDTAHLPYGDKEPATIIKRSLQCAQFLAQKQIKLLVVACSTATAYALEILQKQLSIPVIGVIGPTAQEAANITRNQRLAILATAATTRSQVYVNHIKTFLPQAEVFSIACPLFVPLIEEGFSSRPSTQLVVKDYLRDLHSKKIDTVILGCTHYFFLSPFIQQEMGSQISLVNSATSCAQQVKHTLKQHQLQSTSCLSPSYQFFVSNNPVKFHLIGKKLFQNSINLKNIKQINL